MKTLTMTFVLSICLFLTAYAQTMPEDPLEGRIVFEEKGCIDCHAVNGVGSHIGPDLGIHLYFGTGYSLVADMWNHSSKMILKMKEMNIKRPEFTADEFQRLQTFLGFLRYLGGSGNVSRGKQLFRKDRCGKCHSIGNKKSTAIRLDKLKVYPSPLYLAQSMWNHSPQMHQRMHAMGIVGPIFTPNDIANLSAYLREISYFSQRERRYIYPGNPGKGAKLFKTKQCSFCHGERHIGPDLKMVMMDRSVTDIAGLMWNHSDKMGKKVKELKISWPIFKGNEMANLISYLYFMSPPKTKGSAEDGKRVFRAKGCINCHHKNNPLDAPVFTQKEYFPNDNTFFADLWNHVPKMEGILFAHGQKLPVLTASDVKSLYLYLKRQQ